MVIWRRTSVILSAALLAAGLRGAEPFGAALTYQYTAPGPACLHLRTLSRPLLRGRAVPQEGGRRPLWRRAPGGGAPAPVSRGREATLRASPAPGGETWWEARGSVPFACTECGKCCQVRGDVWLSPEDVVRLSGHLEMPSVQAFADNYGKLEVEGWILLREKPEGGCIFLARDGKACGVYEGRPVQCRVYPFFPRILKTPEGWNGVSVRMHLCSEIAMNQEHAYAPTHTRTNAPPPPPPPHTHTGLAGEVVDAPDTPASAGRLWARNSQKSAIW
jgi:Fe-S-cluster containining protein